VRVTPDTWERLSQYRLETEAVALGGAIAQRAAPRAIARLLDEVEQL